MTGTNWQINGKSADALVRRRPSYNIRSLEHLLVPIDFSKCSERAVALAVSIAQETGSSICLVHVVEARRLLPPETRIYAKYDQSIIEEARHSLECIAARCRKKSILCTCEVRTGQPAHEICKSAGKHSKCVIVIATHGHTGLKRLLLGSTAAGVVRHAPCSVLVVPGRGEIREFKFGYPEKMLVPTDFSKCSIRTLNWAINWARQIGAAIQVLHVVNGFGRAGLLLDEDLKQAERKNLEGLMGALTQNGLIVNTILKHGRVGRQIVQTANQLRSDLIVISPHERCGRRRAILGSTMEYVVSRSDCPVWVLHPETVKAGRNKSEEAEQALTRARLAYATARMSIKKAH